VVEKGPIRWWGSGRQGRVPEMSPALPRDIPENSCSPDRLSWPSGLQLLEYGVNREYSLEYGLVESRPYPHTSAVPFRKKDRIHDLKGVMAQDESCGFLSV